MPEGLPWWSNHPPPPPPPWMRRWWGPPQLAMLFRSVALNLGLKAGEMEELTNTLFNVLLVATSARVALPVHEGVLNIAKLIWQIPSSILPSSKRVEKKYFILATAFEYLYTHPPPGLLIVSVANEKGKQGPSSSTPKNKDAKRLALFGRKIIRWPASSFRW